MSIFSFDRVEDLLCGIIVESGWSPFRGELHEPGQGGTRHAWINWDDQLALAGSKNNDQHLSWNGTGAAIEPARFVDGVVPATFLGRGDLPGCLGRKGLIVAGSFCVREIELSSALRQHVVVDELQLRVRWLLPCL